MDEGNRTNKEESKDYLFHDFGFNYAVLLMKFK